MHAEVSDRLVVRGAGRTHVRPGLVRRSAAARAEWRGGHGAPAIACPRWPAGQLILVAAPDHAESPARAASSEAGRVEAA